MLIVFPLCGFGLRFQKENYTVPKPLINIHGKPLILHIIDKLVLNIDDEILCICPIYFKSFNIDDIFKNKLYKIKIIYLYEPTQGALDTCLKGLQLYRILYGTDTENDKELLIMDGDVIYDNINIIDLFKNIFTTQIDGSVTVFEENTNASCYSFVQIINDNIITNIAEKQRISEFALSGCYGFNSCNTFLEDSRNTLQIDDFKYNGEYYLSSVLKYMLNKNNILKIIKIYKQNILCCGTSDQMFDQLNFLTTNKQLRLCFDLDNTLVTSPLVEGDYTTVQPIYSNIKFLQFANSLGHYIIIYTARRMKTHNGNIGSVMKDIAKITFDTLEKFNISYNEIYFGKPYADFYIDDKAVQCNTSHIQKYMGIYTINNQIESRAFNKISINNEKNIVIKTATSEHMQSLLSEINYYENIPKKLLYLFPKLIEKTEISYTLEKINSPNISLLYISECVTENTIVNIMKSLNELHTYTITITITCDHIKNYYLDKFHKRMDLLTKINNNLQLNKHIELCENFLNGYICERISIIHGDPVFTNIFIDNNICKFIDMKGLIGSINTIYGDPIYDYAKIYQSLLGYDEILHNTVVSHSYKSKLLQVFWNSICIKDHKNIKYMTHYLILTLLPLHEQSTITNCIQLLNELYISLV